MEWAKKNRITDDLILNRDNIHIWYRTVANSKQYKYYGKVNRKLTIVPRTDENILIVDLFVEKENLDIPYETISNIYDYSTNNTHMFTKYKMDCFLKLNLTPVGNWCSGIMEGI
jgi:hypothetical protein